MGEATARKVTEIEETRARIEADLRELEARMPAPLRSAKAVAGVLVGMAGGALLVRRIFSKRSDRAAPTEVVIRVVREDQSLGTDEGGRAWRDRRASRRTSKG